MFSSTKSKTAMLRFFDVRCLRLFKTDIPSAAAGILVVIMKQSLTHRTIYPTAYGVEFVFPSRAHKLSGVIMSIPQRNSLHN